MKSSILVTLFVLTSFFAYSQSKIDLKGPAAKNYKPWKDKPNRTIDVVTSVTPVKNLKGPAAKNYKPWKDESAKRFQLVANRDGKPKLMGPKAKNHKPWRD